MNIFGVEPHKRVEDGLDLPLVSGHVLVLVVPFLVVDQVPLEQEPLPFDSLVQTQVVHLEDAVLQGESLLLLLRLELHLRQKQLRLPVVLALEVSPLLHVPQRLVALLRLRFTLRLTLLCLRYILNGLGLRLLLYLHICKCLRVVYFVLLDLGLAR